MDFLFRSFFSALGCGVCLGLSVPAMAQEPEPRQVLFTNCDVFDGVAETLTKARNVLVEETLISAIGDTSLSADGATVIDCEGRTLMPGLIDAHTHLYMNMPGGVGGMESGTWDEIGPRAAHMANEYLYSGFTTVREMGGGGSDYHEEDVGEYLEETNGPIHGCQTPNGNSQE